MTWEDALDEQVAHAEDLPAALDRLFERARSTWPLWREGDAALQSVVVKTLGEGAHRVLVQRNPGRSRSVHAAVDAAAIAARPCFLCPDSFPEGECGVGWRDLALLPNPFPIVARHLTIPSRRHEPQALAGRAADLVTLAHALGETMAVLYNGPRCGASAPDHFHFQACAAATLPAFDLLPASAGPSGAYGVTSVGRRFAVLFDADALRLAARIEAALTAWGAVNPEPEEPRCNVLLRWQDGRGTALFFPRREHRPASFHAPAEVRIAVSPAVLEMTGLLVVTDRPSFERLDLEAARAVYEDVSPTAQEFADFMEQIQ